MFQNLRKLALNFNERDLIYFDSERKEAMKQFNTLSTTLVNSLHILQLYSSIRPPEPIQRLEYDLKLTADMLYSFPSDVKEKGLQVARENAAKTFDKIDAIHHDMHKHYASLFAEMQKEIASYL